jgi:hypothetical protein
MPREERVALIVSWVAWQTVCASLFGAALGVYSAISRFPADPRFMAAGLVKMPILLFLTSVVTIPSLYVFGALRGLRFSAREFAAMLMVAHTILAAVLGSLAPVVAFFALTTNSYSFMVVLNVFACMVAGTFGVRVFVRALNEPAPTTAALGSDRTLERAEASVLAERSPAVLGDASPRLAEAGTAMVVAGGEGALAPQGVPPADGGDDAVIRTDANRPAPRGGPLAPPPGVDRGAWSLLGWWVILYMFVGAQSGWILRPFIGHPDMPFVLLREKGGGFVSATLHHLWVALGGS